jgi:hypothetical protein
MLPLARTTSLVTTYWLVEIVTSEPGASMRTPVAAHVGEVH